LLLWYGAKSMGPAAQFDARFRDRLPKIMLASIGMGLVLVTFAGFMAPMLNAAGLRYIGLTILVALGIVSYFGIGHLTGAFHFNDFRRALRR